jgi:integrase/recombinase XerC
MHTVKTAENDDAITVLAARLAAFPAADQWTERERDQVVQFAALLDAANRIIARAATVGIDYQAEQETFLANAGRTDSVHTRAAYRASLIRFDAWAAWRNFSPLEINPAQADDFIYYLKAQGRSSAAVRRDVDACSSFFTFLERRHNSLRNPFRGTRARPAKKAVKKLEIPDTEEVELIIASLPRDDALAVSIMAYRGLRVGALPAMTIRGDRFITRSKGKETSGTLPPQVLNSLDRSRPFPAVSTNTLERRVARAVARLHKAGKVRARYSCQDLRHFCAVTEYRKDRDIYRLKGLLGHASIQVTEIYLKGLGEI